MCGNNRQIPGVPEFSGYWINGTPSKSAPLCAEVRRCVQAVATTAVPIGAWKTTDSAPDRGGHAAPLPGRTASAMSYIRDRERIKIKNFQSR